MRKLLLKHLKKHKGGRLESINTFRAFCETNKHIKPDAWLVAEQSLKLPESEDAFGHVFTSLLKAQRVIVKVAETSSPMLKSELAILKLLNYNNICNIIHYICDFSCKETKVKWVNNVQSTPICDEDGNDDLHFLVLEYADEGNLFQFFSKNSLNDVELMSVVKQVGMCLLQLKYNYGISHGDIHSGNVLIERGKSQVNKYTIKGRTHSVVTHGIEPIFIDFGRATKSNTSSRSRSSSSIGFDIDSINWELQEIIFVYDILKTFVKGNNKQYEKMIAIIDEMNKFQKHDLDRYIGYLLSL